MRHKILQALGMPITLLFRVTRPLRTPLKRVFFTARLRADIRDMDFSVQCDGRVHVVGTGNISLGKRCRLGMDTELGTEEEGRIRIGQDVRVNRGCTITSYSEVLIGDFAIIGEFVSIRDANLGMNLGEPMRYQPHTSSPVRVGRDVWIGRGSSVLPGTTIGEGAVIGANSVVTGDIPPFSIAVGVPAKVIRKRE